MFLRTPRGRGQGRDGVRILREMIMEETEAGENEISPPYVASTLKFLLRVRLEHSRHIPSTTLQNQRTLDKNGANCLIKIDVLTCCSILYNVHYMREAFAACADASAYCWLFFLCFRLSSHPYMINISLLHYFRRTTYIMISDYIVIFNSFIFILVKI